MYSLEYRSLLHADISSRGLGSKPLPWFWDGANICGGPLHCRRGLDSMPDDCIAVRNRCT